MSARRVSATSTGRCQRDGVGATCQSGVVHTITRVDFGVVHNHVFNCIEVVDGAAAMARCHYFNDLAGSARGPIDDTLPTYNVKLNSNKEMHARGARNIFDQLAGSDWVHQGLLRWC